MSRVLCLTVLAGSLAACTSKDGDTDTTEPADGWHEVTDLAELEGVWSAELGTGGYFGSDGPTWGSATYEITFVAGADLVEIVEIYRDPDGLFGAAWRSSASAEVPEPSFLRMTRRLLIAGSQATDGSGDIAFTAPAQSQGDAVIFPVRVDGDTLHWGQMLYQRGAAAAR